MSKESTSQQNTSTEGTISVDSSSLGVSKESTSQQNTSTEGTISVDSSSLGVSKESTSQQNTSTEGTISVDSSSLGVSKESTSQQNTSTEKPSSVGPSSVDETESTSSQKLDLQKMLENAEDKYLRLAAEFENYRKRQQREQQRFLQTANFSLIEALLPVIDDMERATNSTSEEEASLQQLQKGLSLVLQKFKKKLEEHGVEEIQVKVGDAFDPELHEAITQAAAPSPELRGKILTIIEKGYRLRERMLRYAKVQTATHE